MKKTFFPILNNRVVKKIGLVLLSTATYLPTSFAQNAEKRVADLELYIAHPTPEQEIVGLKTIIKLEAKNYGPDDLKKGDTLIISFVGTETYVAFLKEDLNKGEKIKIFDELIEAPQYGTFSFTAYLVEHLTKVTYQGQPIQVSWIDPDSTNNVKKVQFSQVQTPTNIEKVEEQSNMLLYPNPVHQELYLRYKDSLKGNYVMKIYDLSGRLIQKENIILNGNTWAMPIYQLPKGIYTLEIVHIDRTFSYAEKFLKQ